MFRTLPRTRDFSWTQRLALIGLFVALTVLSAQIKFYLNSPVPYTLQVLVVLMSGMILGARDGALAQISYIALVWFGLPIDTNGLAASALSGATAGYLIGFIPAAWVAGYFVEHGASRMGQRLVAGIIGVGIIYAFGLPVLKLTLGVDWARAWELSVAPFVAFDLVKALIAAGFTETGRALVMRYFPPME